MRWLRVPVGSAKLLLARWNADLGAQLAITLLITLRLSLELAGVVSMRLVGAPHQSYPLPGDELLNDYNVIDASGSMWQRWDANWYQKIAERGYDAGDGGVHFGVLYPAVSKGVAFLLGGQLVLAELIVASVAFAAAMYLLYHLARLDVGPDAARLTVLLTALFPSGFFLLAPYTEGLFLALSVAALWLARSGRPWAAGVAAYAAVLTRTVGVLLVLPLTYELIRQHRTCVRGYLTTLPSAALPALGLAATVAYQRVVVGDQATPLDLAWQGDRAHVAPWTAVADSWNYVASFGDSIETLNLVCLLGFTLLAVLLLLYRLRLTYAVYTWAYLLLAASREWGTVLGGMNRVVLVLFPCFIALSLWLGPRPRLAAAWLLISAQFQIVLFVYCVHWGFVA